MQPSWTNALITLSHCTQSGNHYCKLTTTGLPSSSHLPRHNLLIDLYGLVSKEGWVSRSHLIDEHTQRPPVHRLVVALREKKRERKQRERIAQRGTKPVHWSAQHASVARDGGLLKGRGTCEGSEAMLVVKM